MLSLCRLALLSMIALLAQGAAAGDYSIADGVYTAQQAESGEALYETHCLTCHDKRYFRPVLKRWNGQPLSMLYLVMSTTMPQTNPASLRESEYLDILAYILSLSRYPEGDTALKYDDGALETITVAPRKR